MSPTQWFGRCCVQPVPDQHFGPIEPASLRKRFLMGFAHIGESRADLILDHFEDDLPRILADSEAIEAELVPLLAKSLPNLGPRIARSMGRAWPSVEAEWACYAWLDDHGITGRDIGAARKIIATLGERAFEVLTTNPYVLVSVLSWAEVDRIALGVMIPRIGLEAATKAPERLLGAVERVWSDRRQRGHTAASPAELRARVLQHLKEPNLADEALELSLRAGHMVFEAGKLRPRGCRYMEDRIRGCLTQWVSERRIADEQIIPVVEAVARRYELHSEQRDAVAFVLRRRFAAIAGYAGTGKTKTARAIIDAWEALTNGNVLMGTLSGKAALVLSRATGRLARTLFRLTRELRDQEETNGAQSSLVFDRDEVVLNQNTLVLVDEASMPALGDWAEIVDWVERRGASLCMLGDSGQLPPVGPGLIFHSVSGSRKYCAILSTIHRQAGDNNIKQIALAIRQREVITWPTYLPDAKGVSLLECREAEALSAIEGVVMGAGGFPVAGHSVQILAARNETVDRLNRHFQRMQSVKNSSISGAGGAAFSKGDPVVHKTNDYGRSLFNGLLGYVVDIDHNTGSVCCEFDAVIHVFKGPTLANIGLAYALTCHKLQGSQASVVVVALENSPNLVEPTWLYTALTRAVDRVVLVGQRKHLAQALRRRPAFRSRDVGFDLSEDGAEQKSTGGGRCLHERP